jgi:glycosyltransferase involved in cell wall biosynthesis
MLPITLAVGEDYVRAIAGAKIAVVFLSARNRDEYTRRCFEIPAIGTMMLAPRTDEILSLFDEGAEVACFSDARELVEKAIWYAKNDAERRRIATAGRSRCLRDGYDAAGRAREFLAEMVALDRERHVSGELTRQVLPTRSNSASTSAAVAVLSNHPAPYREPMFREVYRRGNFQLAVIHAQPSPVNHFYWNLDAYDYPRTVLDDGTTPAKVLSLVARLHKLAPSVIVVPGHSSALSRAALSFGLMTGTSVIYSADTVSAGPDSSRTRQFARATLLRFLAASCSAFWVPGKASREYLVSAGVASERVFEGCYCLDEDEVRQDYARARAERSYLRAKWGFAADQFVFLLVGELLPSRGVSRLVRVFSRLGSFSAGLLVVGGGGETSRVRYLADHSNAHVHLEGPVAFRDLSRFYAVADAYVHPGHEPYSLALMQAAICGLPIVATRNVGAARDVLVEGVSGLTVPEYDEALLASAMTALIRDPARSRELGAEAQRLASTRTIRWAATQFENAVAFALQNAPPPRSKSR